MAAPATVTCENISGKWQLNKTHTTNDQTDAMLSAQGVGWMTRKVISAATLTLDIKHYDDAGIEKIDIFSTLTGGIAASPEFRVLDGTLVGPQENKIFGEVGGRSKRMTKEELNEAHSDKPGICDGWLEESYAHKGGIIVSESHSWTEKTKKKWGVVQVWGFKDIGGERRYVREVYFMHENNKIDKKDIKATMAYDYLGPRE